MTTTSNATLSEVVSTCKSAGDDVKVFNAGYLQFEDLFKTASDDDSKSDILLQWGIALTDNFKLKGSSKEEEINLFDKAVQKYETALQLTPSSNESDLFYHWGDLLLTKANKEKSLGQKDGALQSYSQSCSKFSDSFARQSSVDTLQSWISALSEQSKMADGNQRLWFESQVSEKSKWLEKLRKGETVDLPLKQELAPQEKLKKGNAEKEQGNDYFKKGELTGALRHYHIALSYANGLYGLPPQEEKALKELKSSTYNNMAVVHIKQGKSDRALTDLKNVLDLDENNVKALFRRGKLWVNIGDVDKARADLDKAKDLDPSNKEIRQEIILLEKKEKEQAAKAKTMYSKMFN